ncbi:MULTISPECIES: bifunctional anthranilate synthase component I family protein/class IV aminotransferase [Helicobacter]|uniref:Bifunctional anthranilate synthase component I family protein/class IV aminotransferase n=1 Tax=Helicobacter ibis TaxID=2962633 RepID=A0ABT4VGP1_9HELI|nr:MULTISPECIES: bifunctional anthranilate synthase component I family protein/class IV aminotransferase [Helicobacter]MDA3967152.1 bifunctional anthranilate synthase component I family protein/class IV aminotransferase [Helicobacter sp. WB40]MDA3969280.1 bifunctional anthranilate synthase component I family protein/class IV aminotransferase [Helicobacter ibis]
MAKDKMQSNIDKFAIFGKFLYKNPKFLLQAYNQQQSKKALKIIEKYKKKYYFIGYIKYEFYKYLDSKDYTSSEPCLVFYAFKDREKYKKEECTFEFCPIFTKHILKGNYKDNFNSIKNSIAKGQCYEANLSDEIHFISNLNGYEIFNSLHTRQDTPYKAYISTDFEEIISFSPERFFKIKNNKITTKPMKGTIKKGSTKKEDKDLKNFLKTDTKSMSENVMIVDLLRNDISKIIKANSLKAKLFQIKSYPTLHQMISTISGELKNNINLYKILKALFPCGSITGAPKIETIKLLESLEKRERGIYCGSVGFIHGDVMDFSVAIRTIYKNNSTDYIYGTGSGLVWDSKLDDELKELELKSKILQNDFYLFESMFYKNGEVLFFKEHLERLLNSAKFFNFNTEKILKAFSTTLNFTLKIAESFKDIHDFDQKAFSKKYFFSPLNSDSGTKCLKLKLYKNGEYELLATPLQESKNNKLLISKTTIKPNFLLNHKTSLREHYKQATQLWQDNTCYDVIFFDDCGLLSEGARSNIIIKLDNKLITPKTNNALNGIYRQKLLQYDLIKEQNIDKTMLQNADEIYAINSLRGLKRVVL